MINDTLYESLESYLSTPIHKRSAGINNIVESFPLPAEPHIGTWQQYKMKAAHSSVWDVLHKRLVQLQFPILPNISQTAAYKAATRRGSNTEHSTGLDLQRPEALTLDIHQSAAGKIPILIIHHRADFVKLVQALTKQNEPAPIPDSMGACMVAGYNNWDRIRAYRSQWEAENPGKYAEVSWQAEFKHLIPQKHLYQDRFILLHDGPYSGVPALALGLEENQWRDMSLKIRLDHECAHYFTKRLFDVMRHHLLDELLADYAGIIAAVGHFKADWFLHFMGLEHYPQYREGGRLKNYLDPALSTDPAFTHIKMIVCRAAQTLEKFDQEIMATYRHFEGQAAALMAIAELSLADLAADDGLLHLSQVFNTSLLSILAPV